MRVAFIHPFLFRYARGIERYTFSLANALARCRVEVDLLTWRWDAPIQIDQLDPRVRVHAFPTSRYYAAQAIVPFYTWHLLTHQYDFVWIFFAGYGEAEALTLARRQRFGIVFHYPFTQVPHRYREFQRYGLAKRATQIISVSQHIAVGIEHAFGRSSTVIPNGVDADHFKPDRVARDQQRTKLGLQNEDPVLLTVAALEERKGVQFVLDAMPALLASNPRVKYLVLGEGAYRAQLATQIRQNGLEQSVLLLGVTEDILPYYQAADIFVLLSRGEAAPIAPLEAMAMELPVIVANQPPFDELIDASCGFRVAEQEVSQVVSAVNILLADPARRKVIGQAGRARILKDFTWESVAKQYQEVIE